MKKYLILSLIFIGVLRLAAQPAVGLGNTSAPAGPRIPRLEYSEHDAVWMQVVAYPVTSVPVSDEAAAVLAEIVNTLNTATKETANEKDGVKSDRIEEASRQKILGISEKFYQEHPKDPIRWKIIMIPAILSPRFMVYPQADGVGSSVAASQKPTRDEAAQAAYLKRFEGYLAQLDSAPDAPWEVLEYRDFFKFVVERQSAYRDGTPETRRKKQDEDQASWVKKIDDFAARYPKGSYAVAMYDVVCAMDFVGPGAAQAWQRLASSPNEAVRKRAEGQLAQYSPVDLKFTTLDGRAIDLKTMHEKVLVIFITKPWLRDPELDAQEKAVHKLYTQYHNQGMEVVAVTDLQIGPMAAGTTPEMVNKILAGAETSVREAAVKGETPWPTFFDKNNLWEKEIATKRYRNFGRTFYLIDRSGRILYSTNDVGDIETAVKYLLTQKSPE